MPKYWTTELPYFYRVQNWCWTDTKVKVHLAQTGGHRWWQSGERLLVRRGRRKCLGQQPTLLGDAAAWSLARYLSEIRTPRTPSPVLVSAGWLQYFIISKCFGRYRLLARHVQIMESALSTFLLPFAIPCPYWIQPLTHFCTQFCHYWFQQVGSLFLCKHYQRQMFRKFRYLLLARHIPFMTRFGSASVFAKPAKGRDFSTENNIGYLVLLFQIILVS